MEQTETETEQNLTERKKIGLNTETEFSNTERLKSGIKKIFFMKFFSKYFRLKCGNGTINYKIEVSGF